MTATIAALIELKRTGEAWLVGQLTQQLRALISGGRIPQGTVLRSSRRLATDLSVSRNTVSPSKTLALGITACSCGLADVLSSTVSAAAAGSW